MLAKLEPTLHSFQGLAVTQKMREGTTRGLKEPMLSAKHFGLSGRPIRAPLRCTYSQTKRRSVGVSCVALPQKSPELVVTKSPDPITAKSKAETDDEWRATATLLIDCADKKGVVAASTTILYGQGCNILEMDQHSQPDSGLLFQRLHFDYSDCFLGTSEAAERGLEEAINTIASRFHMTWKVSYTRKKKRMAVLVSKLDHCLYDILLRKKSGEWDVEIPCIISNHETLRPVAEQFGIPFHHLPLLKKPGTTPEEFLAQKLAQEEEIEKLLAQYNIDIMVLARYMQVLSNGFCERHYHHTINIHHSFLPAFEGGYPYHRAYERGVKVIGATAHFATAELDAGPIIEQDVIRISHKDTVQDMVKKGRNLERAVLSRALEWHLDDRVIIHGNKTVVFPN